MSAPHSSVILSSSDPSNSLSRHSKSLSLSRTRSAVFFLNKLKHNSLQRRKVCDASHQQLYRRSHVACWVQRSVKSRAVSRVVTNHKIKESIKRPCYTNGSCQSQLLPRCRHDDKTHCDMK